MHNHDFKRKTVIAMRRFAGAAMSAVLGLVTAVAFPAMTAFAAPDWPSDTGIESEAGIVMDMDSGAVLFGQNIHIPKAPASITKLLTALVVLEHEGTKLDDTVTFSHEAVYNVDSDSGSKLDLDEGDALSVEDCLYVMLLQSSNQAANALAEYVAGSQSDFVERMNETVKEIGCGENTHFANPSGLSDDNQYTTAYDMALIGRAAFQNERLLEIASTKSHKIPATKNNPDGRSFSIEHKMLLATDPNSQYYYPYAVAGKTGFTSAAGQTLVTLAEKDGRRLICVTLKSSEFTHYKDTMALLNFGFDRFANFNIAQNETLLADGGDTVELGGTAYERADLSIETGGAATVPQGAAFADLTRVVETDLPAADSGELPQGAVARLLYQYNDSTVRDSRNVGSAYIISAKKAQEEASLQADGVQGEDPEGALPGSGAGEDGKGGADGENDGKGNGKEGAGKGGFHLKLPKAAGTIAIVVLLLAVVLVGVGLFIKMRRDAERRRMEERRKKRMQRLRDIGCSEEEFNKMLEERINRSRRR